MERFESASLPAKWAKGFLFAGITLSGASIVSGALLIYSVSHTSGVWSSEAGAAAANDLRQRLALIHLLVESLQSFVFVATAVAFLIWLYQAHRNLPALHGRGLKYTPGWAVGWFFVPVMNLVRPIQVMREVWHGSDPSGLDRDMSPDGPAIRDQLPIPSPVGLWWALFLMSGCLGSLLFRIGGEGDQSIAQLLSLCQLEVLADMVHIGASFAAILLVGRITQWQMERHEAILRVPSFGGAAMGDLRATPTD